MARLPQRRFTSAYDLMWPGGHRHVALSFRVLRPAYCHNRGWFPYMLGCRSQNDIGSHQRCSNPFYN